MKGFFIPVCTCAFLTVVWAGNAAGEKRTDAVGSPAMVSLESRKDLLSAGEKELVLRMSQSARRLQKSGKSSGLPMEPKSPSHSMENLPVVQSFSAPTTGCRACAWGNNYLWVNNANSVKPDSIYQINPSNGAVVSKHPAPGPSSNFSIGLAWDGTSPGGPYLWNSDESTDLITKIRVSDFSVVASIAAPETWPRDMAWDGTNLWCAGTYNDRIYKMNPSTGSILSYFSSPEDSPSGLTWDDDSPSGPFLWHANGDFLGSQDYIYQINPIGGAVVLTCGTPGTYPSGLAWDNDSPGGPYLWCVDWETNQIYKLKAPGGGTSSASISPVSPATASGSKDTEFDLLVEARNVTNLFGASFELNFNKTYLNAVSETAESFLGNDVLFFPQQDNTNGKVAIGISKKAGQSAASGTGNVVKVRFKVVQGVTQNTPVQFTLSAVTANDASGNPVTLSTIPDTTILTGSVSSGASLLPVSPPRVNWTVNTEFDLLVEARNVTNLFGASFELNFNKTYLNAVSETAESFLGNDVLFFPQQDNTNGKVAIGISKKAGQSAASGTGNVAKVRFKVVQGATQNTPLQFTLSAVTANDASGNPVTLSTVPDTTILDPTNVGDTESLNRSIPSTYMLYQNHPNPFNPFTIIKYGLPKPGHVKLQVFNVQGRKVAVLVNGNRNAGEHETVFEAKDLSSGLYYYRLQAGEMVITKKLLLIK